MDYLIKWIIFTTDLIIYLLKYKINIINYGIEELIN